MQEELWKGMIYRDKDYSKYFNISNKGRIFSKRTNRFIKFVINKNGYYRFVTKINGKAINLGVHVAVACTFISNPFKYKTINHKDGNKLNNYSDNLEWCSDSYNTQHAIEHNLLKPYGEDNGMHKLSEKDIKEIRASYIPYDKNNSFNALAKRYDVSRIQIRNIIKNINWKHLD